MARIQDPFTSNYTMVHNEFIMDRELGLIDKGMLLVLLQKPEGYNITIRGLAYELGDGVNRISNSLQRLEKLGYLRRRRIVENGRFVDMAYEVSDKPIFFEEWTAEE